MNEPLLVISHLKKHYPLKGGLLRAVNDISLEILPGETLGLVGESGCGKSTLAKLILRLLEPTEGSITFAGRSLLSANAAEMKTFRRDIQLIFQDPYASLSPRMTVYEAIAEPLIIHRLAEKKEFTARVHQLLHLVGLSPDLSTRLPYQLSGGQRQRVAIARALAVGPRLLVCDEPISSLDVSIRAQILHLLKQLQKQLQLTYLFIAHDLGVVKHISNRVAVMYLGSIVEMGNTTSLYATPLHPYTQALFAAIPIADPKKERIRKRYSLFGEPPSPLHIPSGCPFASRCPKAQSLCHTTAPVLKQQLPDHWVACHFVEAFAPVTTEESRQEPDRGTS